MHAELLGMAADLARREEPFVLAVVVRRRPASSSQAGDMALITAAGAFHGWLGGSCTQPTVVREAQRALADGQPRLLALAPDPEAERRPGVEVFPMTCHSGGTVEIYLEPVLPAPRLVVFGVSPTAQALVRLAKGMGYAITAVDPDAEPGLFPAADQVLTAPGALAGSSPVPRFVVVATMGERDETAIREALALAPAYLGVVASRKRFAQLRETLLAGGVTAAALDAIRSPAGLPIGAQLPAEIALSILAEIVERQRSQAAAAPLAGEAEEAAAALEALDPVCGMTVTIATAKHVAEHAGHTYYFCGGGCRERFVAAPERYLPSEISETSA
ncbi:MAG TPA: XdhC family protein [Thermoanaerobaculia bacterium]|nr:XdhC family protein [Thermoanaerobaculia bacterium]